MERWTIGFVDTDPDTGTRYPVIKICTAYSEHTCNWLIGLLKRDLAEHSDEPNREIIIVKE